MEVHFVNDLVVLASYCGFTAEPGCLLLTPLLVSPIDSMMAEALGGRLALVILLGISCRRRAVRIIGGNLQVTSVGADSSRLRRSRMHTQLGEVIASVLEQG